MAAKDIKNWQINKLTRFGEIYGKVIRIFVFYTLIYAELVEDYMLFLQNSFVYLFSLLSITIEWVSGSLNIYGSLYKFYMHSKLTQPETQDELVLFWQYYQVAILGICPIFSILSFYSWSIKFRKESASLQTCRNAKALYDIYRYEHFLMRFFDIIIRVVEVSESWLFLRFFCDLIS